MKPTKPERLPCLKCGTNTDRSGNSGEYYCRHCELTFTEKGQVREYNVNGVLKNKYDLESKYRCPDCGMVGQIARPVLYCQYCDSHFDTKGNKWGFNKDKKLVQITETEESAMKKLGVYDKLKAKYPTPEALSKAMLTTTIEDFARRERISVSYVCKLRKEYGINTKGDRISPEEQEVQEILSRTEPTKTEQAENKPVGASKNTEPIQTHAEVVENATSDPTDNENAIQEVAPTPQNEPEKIEQPVNVLAKPAAKNTAELAEIQQQEIANVFRKSGLRLTIQEAIDFRKELKSEVAACENLLKRCNNMLTSGLRQTINLYCERCVVQAVNIEEKMSKVVIDL